jgi:uncharacterized protein YfcZ (UPF0381/DUF406 family)
MTQYSFEVRQGKDSLPAVHSTHETAHAAREAGLQMFADLARGIVRRSDAIAWQMEVTDISGGLALRITFQATGEI